MSGTSLDGISAAVVRFLPDDANDYRIEPQLLAFRSSPYTAVQRARLEAALERGSARDYCNLAFDLGDWLAEAAIGALADAGVSRGEVRAIGSHGQTLWHDPPHSTWQLGESAVIAERTGISVVSDFRVRDVAAGGQGAPLVPIADAILFAGDEWRALQNIGGIGNVTVVPPGGDVRGVRAFDTGPGVTVIDAVTRLLNPSMTFDTDGALAAAGTPVDSVVARLLSHPVLLDRAAQVDGPRAVRPRVRRVTRRGVSHGKAWRHERGRRRHSDRPHRAQHRGFVSSLSPRADHRGPRLRRRREEPDARPHDRERPRADLSPPLRRPLLRRRSQGSRRLRAPRASPPRISRRQRPSRDRSARATLTRKAHAGVNFRFGCGCALASWFRRAGRNK